MTWVADYEAIEFVSDGAVLRGRLYLPELRPVPVVVMTHGFSATIPMVLDRYAEAFQSSGLAVLAFDGRGLGTSDGEPRGEINAWASARAYRSAVDFAESRPEIDPGRIALWGDSLSACVAFVVAAIDDRVRALVCQVPAMGQEVPSQADPAAGFDAIVQWVRTGEIRGDLETWVRSTVVSVDQDAAPSELVPLTAFRWFVEYGGRYGSGWSNSVVATGRREAPEFDPFACVDWVRIPAQFVMSPRDEMPGAESHVVGALFDRLPGSKELVEVEGGHFGIIEYPSPAFDHASAVEAAFLTRILADGR